MQRGAVAVAQAAPSPDSTVAEAGVVVRTRAPLRSARWITGWLARADADSVLLDQGETSLAIPRWQVEQVQQPARLSRSAGALRGMLAGVLTLGIASAAALPHGPPDREELQASR
jgi:hypothetical protein